MIDSRKARISKILAENLKLSHLEVLDETSMHNVPSDSESHFKVIAISQDFATLSLIKRHQLLNELLKDEFSLGLHALSLKTYTQAEWRRRQEAAPATPRCQGGLKKEAANKDAPN